MWLISLHCCKLFVYFELAVRDHLNDFIMCSCQLDIRLSDWGFWVKAAQSPAVQGLIASALSRDAVKTHRQLNHQLTELSHIHTQTHSSTSLSSLIPSCAPSLTAFLTKTCLASTSSQLSLSHTLSRSLTRTHTHTHRERALSLLRAHCSDTAQRSAAHHSCILCCCRPHPMQTPRQGGETHRARGGEERTLGMTAYLSKQQSCCVEMHGRVGDRGGGEAPCSCSWQHEPQHGYNYQPSPSLSMSTLPRQRAKLKASRSESSWRSPSRGALRAKGGSYDLWTECDCHPHSWHEPYQVTAAIWPRY